MSRRPGPSAAWGGLQQPAPALSAVRLAEPAPADWELDAPAAEQNTPAAEPDTDVATVPSPTATSASARLRAAAGPGLVILGLLVLAFLVYVFGAGHLVHARAQRALSAEFRALVESGPPPPVQTAGGAVTGVAAAPAQGQAIALLRIPDLGLEEVVVEGTRNLDLTRGPGHVRTTELPGELGNAVIAGRRTTFGAPFAGLADLEQGADIEVTTELGRFAYQVVTRVVVEQGQVDALSEAGDARLTLMTSSPAYLASQRLVVVAQLVGEPIGQGRQRPMGIGRDELGLTGEPVALAGFLGWTQLLILGLMATLLLYRRWSRRATYLLTTPVLIALALLSFESLQRLLPATL